MKGKRIVIVGATSGIGLDVARLFISRGWLVGAAGRNPQMLNALKRENPSQVYTAVIDVTHPDAPERLSHLIEEMGGMDIYFHSSGIGYNNPQLDEAKELNTLRTNGEGFTRMIGAAYRYFRTRKEGHIVAISSIAATRGIGSAPAYSSTKRFQMHYLQAIRQLATIDSLRLRVTEIRPRFVDTPLLREGKYPMLMESERVAQAIVKAVIRGKRLLTFDWRYRLLVAFWRMIPIRIWEKKRV